MKTFDGYKKRALTDEYALLAGGGHKPLSDFSASAHTHSIKINGATKTIVASGGAAVDLGNYKTILTAVTSPTASGTSISFIDTISLNTNGVIAVTKKTVPTMGGATASAAGTVGLVPAPAANLHTLFLKGDGTWATPSDTHWTTHLYVGAKDSASNAATTNGNTYIKVTDNSTIRNQYIIKGAGRATVASDASGNITITSPTVTWSEISGKPSTFAPSSHNHPTSQINVLTSYTKATSAAALATTDSLNTALGKLEYKLDVAYDLVTKANDSDGTIENLKEILDVLAGIKDTETIKAIIGKYLPLAGGTMTLGEGLKFHADDNYFGANLDARIISLLDGNGTTCDGGLIIDERATLNGTEYVTELLRIRHDEFKWKGLNILHAGNSNIKNGVITINGTSITPLTSHQSLANYVTLNTALTISGAKTFSNDITLSASNQDRYITFNYTGGTGYDWRIGYLGSGSGDANYFVILSDKTDGTYVNALRIGLTTLASVFGGTVTSSGFVKSNSSNSYVLLGGGGHKALSDFAVASHRHNVNQLDWPGSSNLTPTATANGQEWSIDLNPGSYTGTYFHVWSTPLGASIACFYPDNRHVSIPIHLYVGGYNNTSYALSTSSFICNSWIRTTGSTGWYNESYGGGWYMTDTSWIRSYNGKGVVAGGFYHSSYGSANYLLTSNGGAWAVHTGRNNEANKIVRTDGSGYIQASWINTTSGSMDGSTPARIYTSYDGYIRYMTPGYFFSNLSNSGNNISITVGGQNRTLTVGYANNAEAANYLNGYTKIITVNGDINTYYPVKIPNTRRKSLINTISVWRNLGGLKSAIYPGSHGSYTTGNGGGVSCWYEFVGRYNGWDGNGGYYYTRRAWYAYDRQLSHAAAPGSAVGDLFVWLRGGGTEYYVSTNYPFSDPVVYYERTNASGSSQYPSWVEPRTDIGNEGIIDNTYYGNIIGNANTASGLSVTHYWANVAISTSPKTNTTPQFGSVTIYDGTNSCLYLKTTSAGAYAYLAAFNTGGQYGADVVLHSGSAMVLGAGESAAAMYSNNIDSLRGSENLYLTADGSVKIFTNCDSIGNRKQVVHFDTSGYTYFGSYINIGGHEKNASSPTYVWGSNNSDNFLRSYQTSSLSVGSAYTLSSFAESSGTEDRYVWHSWSDNSAKVAYNSGLMFNPNNKLLKIKDSSGFVHIGNGYIKIRKESPANPTANYCSIEFSYSGGQEVYLGYTPNDSYRLSKGLKVWGSSSDNGNCWFEVEGQTYANGFNKHGSSNNYVLLGGGGHKALSDFSMAHSHPYLSFSSIYPSNTINLNDYFSSSTMYRVYYDYSGSPKIQNGPYESDAGAVINFPTYSGTQVYFNYYNNDVKVRTHYNGHITNWATFITSENIGSQHVSYASSAGDADTSNRAKFLETFQQNSTTNTYGSQYPIWAQWSDATNVRLKCTNYTVWTDKANYASNADTVDNKHASTLLHLDGYYYIPGNGTNSSTKLWSKIGSITFTGAWQDCGGSLTFYEWEARYMMGELKFNIRTSSSKSNAGADIVWMNLTNKKFENSFIICRTGNGTYDIYFEYPAISYINIKFYIISQYDNGYITWQNGSALTSTEPTYVNEKFVSSLTSWVGNADYATSAGTASTANSVAWANITGKPFNWSGQSGQPSWLWGSNDGTNYYVWNPSNFSVNYANSAGNADKLDGYHFSDLESRYVNVSGDSMTGRLNIQTQTLTKSNPTLQQLVINGPSYNASNTLTLQSWPGIGFHMPSLTWASLIFNGNFTGVNGDFSGYVPFYGSGFIKHGSSDSYVLLGGGGHKAESSLSVSYANTSGAISNLTASDTASNTATWRKVWISYENGTTGRPALSDSLAFQTSTGTLKATIFQGNLSGTSNYSYYLRGRSTDGSYFGTSADNLIIAEWNTKSDSRWYLKAASYYECRVAYASSAGYADSAGNAESVDGQHFNWSNNRDDHSYLWAASSNGQAYLVHRASMSVNYANYSGYSQKLLVHDVRSATRTPNYFDGKRVTAWFNNTGTPDGNWWSGIHVKGWDNGYASWELCSYSSTGTGNDYNLYFRNGNNTSWGNWKTILTSSNYTSYINATNFPGLNKSGTVTSITVTGSNGLSGSGTVTTSGTITLSNSGVRSTTINGNYLRVNTNGTNTDLTIPYATNADTVDGYHASSFALRGHTHSNYLPLAGGTMDSNARISHSGNLYLGRSDNGGWVLCLDMCSLSSTGDTYWSLRTSGTLKVKFVYLDIIYPKTSAVKILGLMAVGDNSFSAKTGYWLSSQSIYVGNENKTEFFDLSGDGIHVIHPLPHIDFYKGKSSVDGNYTLRLIENTEGRLTLDSATTTPSLLLAGNIYASGYYESSDITLKTNFSKISTTIEQISDLPVFDFSWKENLSSRNTGTSAQAVQTILPNIVTESSGSLKLNYGVLGTVAGIIACKELVIQKSEIEQLRERVIELEKQLNEYISIYKD